VVYHMKLQALPSAGMPFPSIAPRLDFVFKGPYSLRDAFSFRKRCLICPRERKWLINDSCAFSDERPGRFCLSELHLHPRGALQASPSASRRYLLCLGRFVSFQIYIGVKRNETVGSGMCGKGMWISAFYKERLCKVKSIFA
jgi:hypothetical protein